MTDKDTPLQLLRGGVKQAANLREELASHQRDADRARAGIERVSNALEAVEGQNWTLIHELTEDEHVIDEGCMTQEGVLSLLSAVVKDK